MHVSFVLKYPSVSACRCLSASMFTTYCQKNLLPH